MVFPASNPWTCLRDVVISQVTFSSEFWAFLFHRLFGECCSRILPCQMLENTSMKLTWSIPLKNYTFYNPIYVLLVSNNYLYCFLKNQSFLLADVITAALTPTIPFIVLLIFRIIHFLLHMKVFYFSDTCKF